MQEDATVFKPFDEQLVLYTWTMNLDPFPFPLSKLPSI